MTNNDFITKQGYMPSNKKHGFEYQKTNDLTNAGVKFSLAGTVSRHGWSNSIKPKALHKKANNTIKDFIFSLTNLTTSKRLKIKHYFAHFYTFYLNFCDSFGDYCYQRDNFVGLDTPVNVIKLSSFAGNAIVQKPSIVVYFRSTLIYFTKKQSKISSLSEIYDIL